MLYEIKSWLSGETIATQKGDSLSIAPQILVKNKSVLRGADLRGAEIPKVEKLHTRMLEAIAASENPEGGLNMSLWPACKTTHCRAGWAIHLAGAAGYALEAKVGSSAAGALIHIASCSWMDRVPNFYALNEAAMEDIKACAAKESE